MIHTQKITKAVVVGLGNIALRHRRNLKLSGGGSEVLFSEADWDSNQMYLSLLTDFLDLAAGRKNSSIDLEQATKTVELIENIKNCAIEGAKQ